MTLIFSTLIAVAAYFLKNELFDAIRSFRSIKWEIDGQLTFYAHRLLNINQMTPEAKEQMRKLACELPVRYKQIPLAKQLGRIKLLPTEHAVYSSASRLFGLSNNNGTSENRDRIKEIRNWLDLPSNSMD